MRFTIIRWASAAICCVLVLSLFFTARAERLSGVVLDSSGAPVAGARVLSSDTKPPTQAMTGANGKFVLENLAPEFVGIVALHPEKGWVSTRQISGGSDVELKLTPFSPPFTNDRARAEKILAEMWDWSSGEEHLARDSLWTTLVPYDLERAVERSKNADGALPDSFVFLTIGSLGRSDPAKVAEWGAPLLDAMKDDDYRAMATANLSKAVVNTNPRLASELYENARAIETEFSLHLDDLMAVAVKLKRPEVRTLLDKALAEARKDDEEESGDEDKITHNNQVSLISTLAEADMVEAERVMSLLDAKIRDEAQVAVIRALTRQGGAENLAKAQQLLETLATSNNPQARRYFAASALKVLLAVGKSNSSAALALARRVTEGDFMSEALAAAAYFQDDAMKEVLLREAAAAALQHSSPVGQLANIALLAAPKFPDLARQLTTQALQLWNSTPERHDIYWRDGAARSLLLAVGQTDKLTARGLLEMEWARVYPNAGKGGGIWLLSSMTREMAELDFERALNLAHSIPANEDVGFVTRFGAERALARMLLIGPQQWNSSRGYSWNRIE